MSLVINFETANPPALPTTTNLTGNGGLFNNRPVRNQFGLPPPSNASIFTSINSDWKEIGTNPLKIRLPMSIRLG